LTVRRVTIDSLHVTTKHMDDPAHLVRSRHQHTHIRSQRMRWKESLQDVGNDADAPAVRWQTNRFERNDFRSWNARRKKTGYFLGEANLKTSNRRAGRLSSWACRDQCSTASQDEALNFVKQLHLTSIVRWQGSQRRFQMYKHSARPESRRVWPPSFDFYTQCA